MSQLLCFRSSTPLRIRAGRDNTRRTFEGVAYNGGVMYPSVVLPDGEKYSGPVVLDLDSVIIPSENRPVLDDHDDTTEGVIGRTTSLSVRKSDYTLPVKGVLYAKMQRADKILGANDRGHRWQLSVGMDSFSIQRIEAGRTIRVNNRNFTGPLIVARNAYCTDLSFVAVGGDDTTWATIAARRVARSTLARLEAAKSSKGISMSFEEWMKQQFPSIDLTKLSEVEVTNFRAQYTAATAETDDEEQEDEEEEEDDEESLTEEEEEAALKAARDRKKGKLKASRGKRPIGTDGDSVDRIVARATKAALQASRAEAARCSQIDLIAGGDPVLMKEAETYKMKGWSAEKFELAKLRAGRANPSGATTKTDDDEHQVMEAALLLNAGMDPNRIGKYYEQPIMNRMMSKRYRGFSMVECGDRIIKLAGIHYEGARNQTGHMQAVRNANAKLEASGFTSMQLSSILENVSDKVLLDAYNAVETTWQLFAAVRSLNDFKIHSSYALDPLSVFKKVGQQGEFANLDFSDRKYNLQAESYGVRMKIDFPTWRNDDLGAISGRLDTIGQLGASTIEQVFNVLVMLGINNTAMFHANNRNYEATAASTFGVAGLKLAEQMWGNQVRQNGTPLGVSPQTLMVGTALKTDAGTLFTSSKLNEVFDSTNNSRKGPVGQDNPYVGRFKPQENPYLNNTLLKNNTGPTGVALAHQSNALWMMLAKMGNNAPFHVGFLDGNQSPKVEVIQNQSEMIGFEIAAALHFGVGYGDPLLAMCFNPANA